MCMKSFRLTGPARLPLDLDKLENLEKRRGWESGGLVVQNVSLVKDIKEDLKEKSPVTPGRAPRPHSLSVLLMLKLRARSRIAYTAWIVGLEIADDPARRSRGRGQFVPICGSLGESRPCKLHFRLFLRSEHGISVSRVVG